MEGGDARRVLKCAGGAQDKTIINRIMLRFRPIAPKPVNGDSISCESTFGNKSLGVTSKRVKRKYVRVCKNNNRRRRRVLDEAKEDNEGNKGSITLVTLQLMPETADLEKSTVFDRSLGDECDRYLDRTAGDNYQSQDQPSPYLKFEKTVAADQDVIGLSDQTALESWVTVESVTDTCMDEGEMENCTDVERIKSLEEDTRPCFVSDSGNHVLWVNEAYKKMVGVDGADETTVGLVVKQGFEFPRGAFSCRVGLQYGDGEGKKTPSKVVPCDAWEMSSGGFAWRLDVKAALSLGL
ncbi:DIG-like 4 [Hibiscus trionum]|uniref:DIG-like 4 n=1 Tax=Hibiscus trionum TaxID=183268 RepID=A0A9W7J2S6_HIBTR|nr:DIG-like 4 [Hibiscus trionum]